MKLLDATALERLLEGARTIEEDAYGIKVARLASNHFLKIYRRKRLLSSALLVMQAERFARNARQLMSKGFTAPEIVETLRIPSRNLNAVIYVPLPGETLRSHWRQLPDAQLALEIEDFGRYLGQLHNHGVYFRSLHLGNVLRLPSGDFGLIDLSDMKIEGGPLASWKRRRNLHHILRYPEDISWVTGCHRAAWIRGYEQSCGKRAAQQFAYNLQRIHPLSESAH